jgi:hypothetical protein
MKNQNTVYNLFCLLLTSNQLLPWIHRPINLISILFLVINTKEFTPKAFPCAGILEQSMGARNRVIIGLLYRAYRPAWLHRLAESIPWNRFLSSLKD